MDPPANIKLPSTAGESAVRHPEFNSRLPTYKFATQNNTRDSVVRAKSLGKKCLGQVACGGLILFVLLLVGCVAVLLVRYLTGPPSTVMHLLQAHAPVKYLANDCFTTDDSHQVMHCHNQTNLPNFTLVESIARGIMFDNYWDTIPSGFLENLPNLQELTLSSNRVANLHVDSFRGLAKLEKLNLADNSIRTLRESTFLPLTALKSLHLENNSVTNLTNCVFGNLKHLLSIHLSKNSIEALEADSLSGLDSIREIWLDYNRIVNIHHRAFVSLKSLVHLDLSFNSITFIDERLFQFTVALATLKLGNNQISTIPNNLLTKVNFTKHSNASLSLVYNKITHINREVFHPRDAFLDKIDLRGNPVDDCDALHLPRVATAYLPQICYQQLAINTPPTGGGGGACLSDPCSSQGTCRLRQEHTDISYDCICAPGYAGPDCRLDIDECLLYVDLCPNICLNTQGSYTCQRCGQGYCYRDDATPTVAEASNTTHVARILVVIAAAILLVLVTLVYPFLLSPVSSHSKRKKRKHSGRVFSVSGECDADYQTSGNNQQEHSTTTTTTTTTTEQTAPSAPNSHDECTAVSSPESSRHISEENTKTLPPPNSGNEISLTDLKVPLTQVSSSSL